MSQEHILASDTRSRNRRWWWSSRRGQSAWRTVFALAVSVALVAGLQAGAFFSIYGARLAQANELLFELQVETRQQHIYRRMAKGLATLRERSAATTEERLGQELAQSSFRFESQFGATPLEAIETLRVLLPQAASRFGDKDPGIVQLQDDFGRMDTLYADRYKAILQDFDRPPLLLWPTASILARYSNLRAAATFNRALYLSQIGEFGTARAILSGLHAATEDKGQLALIYYSLGRLQFELWTMRPESEFYLQAVKYLRQSLQADADLQLAKRLLQYLLSLTQGEIVIGAGEGRTTAPTEGEGTDVPVGRRIF